MQSIWLLLLYTAVSDVRRILFRDLFTSLFTHLKHLQMSAYSELILIILAFSLIKRALSVINLQSFWDV